MVDTEDLAFVEDGPEMPVQLPGRGEVPAERFLHHEPPRVPGLLVSKTGRCELCRDVPEEARRAGQVEQVATRRSLFAPNLRKRFPKPGVGLGLVEGPPHPAHVAAQRHPEPGVYLPSDVLLDGGVEPLAEGVVVEVGARKADEAEPLRETALGREVEERRQEQAPRQIARAAEDDEDAAPGIGVRRHA